MQAVLGRLVAAQRTEQAAARDVPLDCLARLLRGFDGTDAAPHTRPGAASLPGLVEPLTVLLTQPTQLVSLALTQRTLAVTPALLSTPVAQRPLVDPELAGHLGDRLTGLPDQTHRTLLEVPIELPACLCHRLPPQRAR